MNLNDSSLSADITTQPSQPAFLFLNSDGILGPPAGSSLNPGVCINCYVMMYVAYQPMAQAAIYKYENNTFFSLGSTVTFPYPGPTATFEFVKLGGLLSGKVNGIEVLSPRPDSSGTPPFNSGQVGFMALNGPVFFDNIKVNNSLNCLGTPIATPTITNTPAPTCLSYNSHVTAFYGGNTGGRLRDSSVHGNDLTMPAGAVSNPLGGPEGDRWLGAGLGSTAFLQAPPAAWPGDSGGAMEVQIQYQDVAHVQEQVILIQNASQYLSLYLSVNGQIGVDYTVPGLVNKVWAHGMQAGQTYTLRLEWGSFGVQVRINGVILAGGPSMPKLQLGIPMQITIGAYSTSNVRDLASKLDALAFLDDPNAVVCDSFVATSTPTNTPCPSIVRTPGTDVIAFYGGNSTNPLLDATGHGHTLIPIGSVLHPPCAPEGDQWLGKGFSVQNSGGGGVSNYFDAPPSAWPTQGQGAVEFDYEYTPEQVIQEQLFVAGGNPEYISAYLSQGNIGVDFRSSFGADNILVAHNMVPGQTYTLRVEWDGNGLRIRENGALLAFTSHVPFDSMAPSVIHIGAEPGLPDSPNFGRRLSGKIDALAVIDIVDGYRYAPAPAGGGNSASRYLPKSGAESTLPKSLPSQIVVAPNPARLSSSAFFKVDEESAVQIVAYNMAGDTVAVLGQGRLAAGIHKASLSYAGLASGIYLVNLQVDPGTGWKSAGTFKAVVLK